MPTSIYFLFCISDNIFLHICNKSCPDITFWDHRGPSHKDQSRSLGRGRIAGREPRTVKLRISMFKRQDERKERPGGLKHSVIQELHGPRTKETKNYTINKMH